MNIAEKLQELRKQKGISQPKLCEELKKTQGVYMAISTLRNYENVNNPRIPKNEILNALAKYYNVDIEYLLNDEAENVTTENIKINELLGLNDEAIQIIKKIGSSDVAYKNILNNFLTTVELEELVEKLKNYMNLINIIEILEDFTFDSTKLSNKKELLHFAFILENIFNVCAEPMNITMADKIRLLINDLSKETENILNEDKKTLTHISLEYSRFVCNCV